MKKIYKQRNKNKMNKIKMNRKYVRIIKMNINKSNNDN